MLKNIITVARNTFTEAIRQPIFVVIIFVTSLLYMLSPSMVMFGLREDNQLLWDIGLSNLLVSGLFIAVFAASTVVTDEIDRKTALTVISKSVSRSSFVLGKFLGITSAVLLSQYVLILAYFITMRHGVLINASDYEDPTTLVFGCGSLILACLIGAGGNYFYKWRFGSTTVVWGAILATISVIMLILIDPHWKFNPGINTFHPHLAGPVLLIVLASIVFSAVSVAAAMRFNMVTTLIISVLVFLLGTMVHYQLGPIVTNPASGMVKTALAWCGLAAIPSINLYLVTDMVYEKRFVPADYLLKCIAYTALYCSGAITAAIMLFRKRDIG